MNRIKKIRKSTQHEAMVLSMIARSLMTKTFVQTRPVPLWQVAGLGEISHETAQALIRSGWVNAERDGSRMFNETKMYKALKP